MHTHTHTYIYTHVKIHTHTHRHMITHTRTSAQTHIHVRMHLTRMHGLLCNSDRFSPPPETHLMTQFKSSCMRASTRQSGIPDKQTAAPIRLPAATGGRTHSSRRALQPCDGEQGTLVQTQACRHADFMALSTTTQDSDGAAGGVDGGRRLDITEGVGDHRSAGRNGAHLNLIAAFNVLLAFINHTLRS